MDADCLKSSRSRISKGLQDLRPQGETCRCQHRQGQTGVHREPPQGAWGRSLPQEGQLAEGARPSLLSHVPEAAEAAACWRRPWPRLRWAGSRPSNEEPTRTRPCDLQKGLWVTLQVVRPAGQRPTQSCGVWVAGQRGVWPQGKNTGVAKGVSCVAKWPGPLTCLGFSSGRGLEGGAGRSWKEEEKSGAQALDPCPR